MLRSLKGLKGYTLLASDGEIGRAHDFYFDAQTWTIRYLVVDPVAWLSSRLMFLSPIVLDQPNEETQTLSVSLTQEQIKNSPEIDPNKPISRQQEVELHAYFNWPPYWDTGSLLPLEEAGLAPTAPLPPTPLSGVEEARIMEKALLGEFSGDPHLHSANQVIGYYIQARDDNIGHISPNN